MTRARNSANLASHGNLFVDIANDRTGIGSVVPAQNLHVAGTAGFHADTTFVGDLYSTTWDRSANSLSFQDSAKIRLGTDNDASIRHDGSNMWIQNSTGYIYMDASSSAIRLISQASWASGAMAAFNNNGSVQLFYDAQQKFLTQDYGINVIGTTDTDGLVVSGVATVTTMNVTGVLTYEDVTSVDSVGIITAREGVVIPDNKQLKFGNSTDFKIEHNTNENYIDSNSGHIYIRANVNDDEGDNIYIQPKSGENSAIFIHDGAVQLYYDNSIKFATSNTGVSVTGAIASSGNLSISNVAPKIFLTDTDSNSDFAIRNMHGVFGIHDSTNSANRLTINSSGNATFSGDLTVSGNLSVTGTTTQNNSVSTSQKTITLASGAANNAAVDGAGIVVDAGSDTDKTLKWLDSTDRWTFTGGDVAANAFYGNGANLTNLNGSNIASGTVPVARIGTGTKNTSTFYRGDGTFATVTPPAITAISNPTNNRIITSEGGTTVNAEPNLTFSGDALTAHMSAATPALFIGDSNRTSAGQHLAEFRGYWDGNHVARIVYAAGNDTTNKDDGIIKFHTTPSGGGITERLRIDSSGRVMIGNTDAGSLYAAGNNLVVGSGGASNQGITIYTGNAQQGILAFADGTSGGAQQYAGYMIYDHNANNMLFATQATERLRIDSNGTTTMKPATHDGGLIIVAANANQETRLTLTGKHSNGTSHSFLLNAKRSVNRLDFVGGGTTRASLLSTGEFGIGTVTQESLLQVGGGTSPHSNKPTVQICPLSGNAVLTLRGGSPTLYFDRTSSGIPTILTDGADLAIKNGSIDNYSSILVQITSSGDMGVGTNSPDRRLDVSGTGNVYGKFQSTNATGAGIEVKDTAERWLIQADGGVGPGLAFYDLGRTSYRMIIDSSGRLLVGKTSTTLNPQVQIGGRYVDASSTTLDLDTTGSVGPSLELFESGNTANNIALMVFNHGSLKSAIGGGRSNTSNWGTDLRFYTHKDTTSDIHETYERMRITSGGQMILNGTNSTSPDGFNSLIQVNSANHTGSITIGRHTANGNGPALLFQKSRSGSATPGNGVVADNDSLGVIRWYGSDGNDRNSFAANIECEVDGTPGSNDMPGKLTFGVTKDGEYTSRQRMSLHADGMMGLRQDSNSKTYFFSSGQVGGYSQVQIIIDGHAYHSFVITIGHGGYAGSWSTGRYMGYMNGGLYWANEGTETTDSNSRNITHSHDGGNRHKFLITGGLGTHPCVELRVTMAGDGYLDTGDVTYTWS